MQHRSVCHDALLIPGPKRLRYSEILVVSPSHTASRVLLLCCLVPGTVLSSISAVDTSTTDGTIASGGGEGSITEGIPVRRSQAALGGGQGDRA